MEHWKTTGIIATLVIVLSIPLYLLRVTVIDPKKDRVSPGQVAEFVGSKKCSECHKKQYDTWKDFRVPQKAI
jgi:hypothetical protein